MGGGRLRPKEAGPPPVLWSDPAAKQDDKIFVVDEILGTRKKNGRREFLTSWMG